MLTTLHIQNYILIKDLKINLTKGLSIITGETGAGKSIMVGALSLLAGQRADTDVLRNKTQKCIVEGTFFIKDYDMQEFFEQNNLDYDDNTIIRREILPQGKTRAFINDIPVSILQLKELSLKLIDIHSQHQVLTLNKPYFQLSVIDVYAKHINLLEDYKQNYKKYKQLSDDLRSLIEKEKQIRADYDYFLFQYQELERANLAENEQDDLEAELKILTNAEEIKTNLSKADWLLNSNENNILNHLSEVNNLLNSLGDYHSDVKELHTRLTSAYVELKDIANEIERLIEKIIYDPKRLEEINQRLSLLYRLQQKHYVKTVKELIHIQNDLKEKLNNISSLDEKIQKLNEQVAEEWQILRKKAEQLSLNRKKAIPEIERYIKKILVQLAMPDAVFKIAHEQLDDLDALGIDRVLFLFTANKGGDLKELTRVASGGELSRLMLSVKSLITAKNLLPTIILDEIDAGVSGEIASQVGTILKKMSSSIQLIAITHLPQIAAKGETHFMAYKETEDGSTISYLKQLNRQERIVEIAKLLSGDALTDVAIENAKELLKIKNTRTHEQLKTEN